MAYFLSPALVRLRTEINALWQHRDKTSDGWIGDASHKARPSDHNPDWSDGGIVRAIDIDEDLTVGLAEVGAAMPLVNAILRDPRVRYVIYEGRIWNVDTQRWSPYSGPNAHRHHVHVSVRKVGNYDRDASPWNLAARIGNDLGPIPTVTIPTIPGAPAPLTKGFLMTLSDAQQEKLAREVSAVFQGMFYGSFAGGVRYPGLLAIEAETQKRVTQVPAKVWATPVQRTGGPVSALQDLANGTTNATATAAQIAGLRVALTQLAEGRDVDLDAIEERMRDVLATGVVKVEISVPTPASQPAPEDVIDVDAITKED